MWVGQLVNFVDNVHSRNDLPKNDIVAVQVRSRRHDDGKVRGVGVWASVGHGQETLAVVLELEASLVVGKHSAVYAFGLGSGLVDEAVDDAIKVSALEAVVFSGAFAAVGYDSLFALETAGVV